MTKKMRFFFTTLCPKCKCRYGHLALGRRRKDRFLNYLSIYLHECHSCNIKFHAFSLKRP